MASDDSSFQANSLPALLLGAAIALLVQASPARSEMLDVSCAGNSGTVRLVIDTSRSTVTQISTGANGPSSSAPYPAKTTDQFIKFSGPLSGNSNYSVEGILDRVAGTFSNTTIWPSGNRVLETFACRRATQQF